MKSKIWSKIVALIVVIAFSCISMPKLFAGEFDYNLMNLSTYVSSKILPLDSLEGNLSSSQTNRIMKNGFLSAGTESYGYFRIRLSYEFIGDGKLDKLILGLFIVGNILTAGIGTAFLPIGQNRYNTSALVEIIDINKKVIKEYTSSIIFDGIMTCHTDNYTYEAEALYRDSLKNCLTAASRDSDEINAALISAKMSGKIPANARIAVIGANQNPDTIQGTRLIETQLFDTGRFRVVDRVNIDKLVAEIIFSRSVYVNDAVEIGRILSAQYIVYVEISGEGSNRKINYKVLSVGTSEILASYVSPLR
jgi:hypothetical protein